MMDKAPDLRDTDSLSVADLAGMIDQTLLKPLATFDEMRALCEGAVRRRFGAVCVNPVFVPDAHRWLTGSDVKVCTVTGFPLGAETTAAKIETAVQAIRDGAREIDMVMFLGALRSGEFGRVREDVAAVARACHENGVICKVILETALLNIDEKRTACNLCVEAAADFVKTATGFNGGGAAVEDVALMHSIVAPHGLRVKAAGGIRTLADAQAMIRAGASRLGTSAGEAILDGAMGRAPGAATGGGY
jgi:deoxyribose-phosphate aldolase